MISRLFRGRLAALCGCLLATSSGLQGAAMQGFTNGLNPPVVSSVAAQPDGKVIAVGHFMTYNGVTRNNILRMDPGLHYPGGPAGILDTGFNPNINDRVVNVAVQDDGQILVSGLFTTVGGTSQPYLARLDASGALDTGFAPVFDNTVLGTAIQPDGKVLAFGFFNTVNGTSRPRVARLNTDGTLDTSFNANASGWIRTVHVQPDGQILVTGGSIVINSVGKGLAARLNPDGTLDTSFTFTGSLGSYTASASILPNGKIVLASGEALGIQYLRVNADGSADGTFSPYDFSGGMGIDSPIIASTAVLANGAFFYGGSTGTAFTNAFGTDNGSGPAPITTGPTALYGVTPLADGATLVYGWNNSTPGDYSMERVDAGTFTNQITVTDGYTRIQWARSGAIAEVSSVSFQWSLTGSGGWSDLGTATRISGGWELTGLSLPDYGFIKARAVSLGGGSGVARSVMESRAIAVRGVAVVSYNGVVIPSYMPPPASVAQGTDFGDRRVSVAPGLTRIFKIENTGAQPFTISWVSTSTHTPYTSPSVFSHSGLSSATVDPGASRTFTLTFLPTASGPFQGSLFFNHNGSGGSYTIPLIGTGVQSEIEVRASGVDIPDNSSPPQYSNSTHFNTVKVSESASFTYTINNLGTGALTVSNISLAGTNPGDFAISGITLPAVVPVSGSTTFTVTFKPTAIGGREAMVNIDNDDVNESLFNFKVGGDATATWPLGTETLYTSSSVSLSGPRPNLAIGFTPLAGQSLKVINNTGLPFISTTYSDLAQGQEISLPYNGANYFFVADYYGGDGNDLVLHWKGTRPYAWGTSTNGRLGDSATLANKYSPVSVAYHGTPMAGKTIVQVAAGTDHSLALDANGNVYAWGLNTSYQVGDGTATQRNTPVAVTTAGSSALASKTVVEIAAGDKFSLALCSDNTLVAWGENANGECGNSSVTTADRQIPTLVDVTAIGSRKVVGIATGCSASHSLLRCDDGAVFAWGINTNGCLGVGDATVRRVPTAVSTAGVLSGKKIIAMAAGLNFSVVTCDDGTMHSWGVNTYGQLGVGSTTASNVPVSILTGSHGKSLSAGAYHAIMTNEYEARTWGYNNYRQLGNGTTVAQSTTLTIVSGLWALNEVKVSAGQNHGYALCNDHTLIAWGRNNVGLLGQDSLTPTTSNVGLAVTTVNMTEGQRFTDVAAGLVHTHALVASPQAVISVEQPESNVLADGASVDFDDVFLNATHYKTFTIRNIGTGVLAGLTTTAPTGTHAANYTVSQPVLTSIQPGETTTFIVGFKPTAGGVRTAAFQIMGESLGTTLPIDVNLTGTGTTTNMDLVIEIPTDLNTPLPADASIPVHTETFTATGKSLGLTLAHTPTPGQDITLMKLTGAPFMVGTFTGLNHASQVTLSYGGQSYEYIVNYYGGSGNDLVLVWKHSRLFTWGYDGGFQGRLGQGTRPALADKTLPWPIIGSPLTGKTIFSVAQGSWHTVVLCSDGTLYAWGDNRSGQLGSGVTYTPVNCSSVPVAVNMTGVLAGKTIVAIAAGHSHTLALDKDGIVYAWGMNYGRLGDGTNSMNSTTPIAVSRASGTALYNKKVCAIAAGLSHSLAICEDYTLAAWGSNSAGQLGDNTTTNRLSPATVIRTSASGSALYNKKAVAIGAGGNHSVALDIDGKVYAWGDNLYGQLGNGTTTDSLKPLAVNVAAGSALEGKTLKSIHSGAYHLFGITTDGDIIAWGGNSSGQLGDGTTTNRTLPVLIADDSNIKEICAGSSRSQFLYQDGSLFIIDANLYGETNTDPSAFAPGEYYAHLPVGAFSEYNSALVAGPVVGSPVVAIITPTGVEHLRSDATLGPVASPSYWRLETGFTNPYIVTIHNIGTADLTGISFGYWWGTYWDLDVTATSSTVAPEGSTTFTLTPLSSTWTYDHYYFDSNIPRFIIPVSN